MSEKTELSSLSDPSTVIYKFAIPIFIIAVAAIFELAIWQYLHGDKSLYYALRGPIAAKTMHIPESAPFLIALGSIVFLLLWLWHYSRVKRVKADEQCLYISNYLEEISVPLANLQTVRQVKSDPRLIELRLNKATKFGASIYFIAPIRFLEYWYSEENPHPVVATIDTLKQNSGLSEK